MKTARHLIALVLGLAACGSKPAPVAEPVAPAPAPVAEAPPPAAAETFDAFVDAYFDAKFAWSPGSGTEAGFHQYDDKLQDRSRARIDQRVAELHDFEARLGRVDRGKLGFDEAIDAEALAADIRSELIQLETVRGWENNPMSYAAGAGGAIDAIMKRDYAPGPQRLRSVIARLRQVPALYAAGKANVKTPPKEFTEVAIRMMKGSIGFYQGAVTMWAKGAAGGDAALLAELDAANNAAIASAKDFGTWLEKDLLPRSTGKYAVGAETFAAMLAADEMVETPIPELLAIGEAQLQKDYDAIIATAKKLDPKRTPQQVIAKMSEDHPKADDLIPAVARSLEEVRKFIVDRDLITIPSEVRPKVAETPPYARGGGFASMDTPGPFETKATEAFYYVTPVEKDWDAKHQEEHLRLYNRPVIALIDIHEAFPGHYVQFLYAPQFPTKTRKLIGAGTNAEGWAHYAEQMVVDEGFGGKDLRYRLAQLTEALVRDCRYVVGIKLHTAGWTVEQGAKLFVDKAFMEPANAYEESRRGAFNPTYLYYTLGKIEIYKLREEAMKQRGWSLKQFHDAFVGQGALPIPLVRKILLEKK